jgi:hypothetical protein
MAGVKAMARKKKDKDSPSQTPNRHKYQLVGLRLPDDLREAIQELADKQRRSLAQMCWILVEEAMAARNLWEPPEGNYE